MAYPTKPSIQTSYTAVEQALGDGTLPGQELDNDLANLKTSLDALNDFVRGVTRSDGRLANLSVTRETLASDILLGFDPPETWSAARAYAPPQTVFFDDAFYLCVIEHTSGAVFADDLASGRWTLLADLGAAATAAAAARDAAAVSATNAASSATAASTSATNAANSATAAATSATNAAGSATAASTSATNAANSATAASGSATSASSSATAAAASFDSFDDRYLGAKAADPTLDNDGAALLTGALYFNTTFEETRVWTGTVWKAAGSAVNGTTRRQSFTATAGQTVFTVTGGYDAGFADVYLNGVKLVNGTDVTVTSGTQVVLTVGATVGDSVDVVAYGAFEVANTYTQAEVNGFLAAKASLTGVETLTNKTLTSLNGGPLAGFRNAIINGNFDHWQRGTSLSAATGNRFLADRWRSGSDGTTIAPSRQAFALGQTDVPNEPEYFHRNVVSSVAGVGNNAIFIQKVEGVRTLAGQTATLSFYAKADAAKNIALEFVQNFGTGGSPSAEANAIGVTTLALTTTFQKFTVTVAIPSIAGKTIGTGENDTLSVFIWLDAGSNFNARTNSLGQQSGTFDIAQVQLEAGSVATPFERRPVGTELALCQRYYCETIANARFIAAANNHLVNVSVYWPVRMRSNPSVTRSGGSANTSSVALQDPSVDGLRFEIVSAAAGDCLAINQTIKADAEL